MEDYRIARESQAASYFVSLTGGVWQLLAPRSKTRIALSIQVPIDTQYTLWFGDNKPTGFTPSITQQFGPQIFDILHHGDLVRSGVWVWGLQAGGGLVVTDVSLFAE